MRRNRHGRCLARCFPRESPGLYPSSPGRLGRPCFGFITTYVPAILSCHPWRLGSSEIHANPNPRAALAINLPTISRGIATATPGTWPSSSTTMMPATILPGVCPLTPVKRIRYPSRMKMSCGAVFDPVKALPPVTQRTVTMIIRSSPMSTTAAYIRLKVCA